MYRVFVTYSQQNIDDPKRPHIFKVTFAWATLGEIFEGLIEHIPPEVEVTQITIRKI